MNNHSHPGFDKHAAKKYDHHNDFMAPIFENLFYLMKAILNELPPTSKIICVGVGTGTEIIELAETFPAFTFVAVDPSDSMLAVCKNKLQKLNLLERCNLIHGYVQDLPHTSDFDAALCILVGHHTSKDGSDRHNIFSGIAKRLKPNGYFINAEMSFDLSSNIFQDTMEKWKSMLRRNNTPEEKIQSLPQMMKEHLSILEPKEVERLFTANGFKIPIQFFQSFLIRAWYAQK